MDPNMFPQEFLERMKQMLGTEYHEFAAALEQEPAQALRFNPLKRSRTDENIFPPFPQARQETAAPFGSLSRVPWASDGYYYSSSDHPGKHPLHEAGLYYIQEPSAMAPAELLEARPGHRVLDLCAAPGGKSTQLAAKLQGEGILFCNEIHPARARILSENIERMGVCNALVTNETPERLASRFPEYFDRILVDAPCSGEGMFRKNPDACQEWSPENVELCAKRQDGILDRAAEMLRPGGRMVYSTCTFAPAENEGAIARFLERHEEFILLPIKKTLFSPADCDGVPAWGNGLPQLKYTLRLWPHRLRGEGHFAALLQKTEKAPKADPSCGKGSRRNGSPLYGISEKELTPLWDFCKETLMLSGPALPPSLCGAVGLKQESIFLPFGDNVYLCPASFPSLKGLKILRPGLHLGELKKNRFEPSHGLALALSPRAVLRVRDLPCDSGQAAAYLRGQTFPAEGDKGWHLICADGFGLGWGKLAGGIMKNHYPKGLRIT